MRLKKFFFDDDKKFYLNDIFFMSNRNVSAKHVKIVKNSRFFKDFWSKFQVFPSFFKTSQITDFSRFFLPKLSNSRFFSGKVATLHLVYEQTLFKKKLKRFSIPEKNFQKNYFICQLWIELSMIFIKNRLTTGNKKY